uniref:Uncharacterized protein n=1 Tax=viral metagenome TaxID=1070528 RepID=A0A6C0BMI5_9ZZZZ
MVAPLFLVQKILLWFQKMRIRYVRAGAPSGGNGTKCYPYNSLAKAQAKAHRWTTLVVLPSHNVLCGSLVLRDGQEVVGIKRDRARLSNPDATLNNGDVIVTNGDNKLKNLSIVGAARCGVEALNADNLKIENCSFAHTNPGDIKFPSDIKPQFFTSFVEMRSWPAISFHGGATKTDATVTDPRRLQPLNTRPRGKLTLHKCTFTDNAADVLVGAGDMLSPVEVASASARREYDIHHCTFSNSRSDSVVTLVGSGGRVSGQVHRCAFDQHVQTGVSLDQIYVDETEFPGRGNYQWGVNQVSKCTFTRCLEPVFVRFNGFLEAPGAVVDIVKCHAREFGRVPATPTVPSVTTVIEPFEEAAAININVDVNNPGGTFEANVRLAHNHIVDTTGRMTGMRNIYFGKSPLIHYEVCDNHIAGTTIALAPVQFTARPVITPIGRGTYDIHHNVIENVDSALVTGVRVPFERMAIRAHHNCFQNTGARNAPPIQQPPFDNGSYYGATLVMGGVANTAFEELFPNGDLGNFTMDFGGGPLESPGQNSFINTTGAHTWVTPLLTFWAAHNWFNNVPPLDAGAGGAAVFEPQLESGPDQCPGKCEK